MAPNRVSDGSSLYLSLGHVELIVLQEKGDNNSVIGTKALHSAGKLSEPSTGTPQYAGTLVYAPALSFLSSCHVSSLGFLSIVTYYDNSPRLLGCFMSVGGRREQTETLASCPQDSAVFMAFRR